MNIAIVSPNKSLYSETFIQAHKEKISGNIYYYYGGFIPTNLEGQGPLLGNSTTKIRINKLWYKISGQSKKHSLEEAMFAHSIKVNKIQVIIAEFGMTGATLTPICKLLNIPLYVFFHGYDASVKEIIENFRLSYKELFSFASKVFVVSTVMYNKLLDLGCPVNKLVLNTYGPSDDFFKVTSNFKSKKIIAVGRFVDKKAPYLTIFSFCKVLDKHPDAKLYMAGDGVLYNSCLNIVKYLKVQNSIIFLGVIDHNTFIEHLQDSVAFVQHSITAINGDSEGAPVSIIEAQAAGIPVVSTIHAGIPDIVIDGYTGYLVEEGDVETMAIKICNLLDDLNVAAKMGAEAKKNIYNNFSLKKHIEIIESNIIENDKP